MYSIKIILLLIALISFSISNNEKSQKFAQLHEIFDKIMEFQIRIDKISTMDKMKIQGALFVIGDSGEGKSAFINFLRGLPLKAVLNKGKYVLTNNESNPIVPIGHQRKSKTKQPKILIDEFNTVLVDTPGFEDTQGYKRDILNMLLMNKILNQIKLKKIVLVISQTTLESGRSQSLKQNILKVKSIFGESFGSLIIVVSKATDSFDYRSEMNAIIEDDDSMTAEQNRDFLRKTVNKAKIIPFYAPYYNSQKVEEKQLKHFYSNQRILALKAMHDVEAVKTNKAKNVFSGDNANKIKNMIEQVQKSVELEFEYLQKVIEQISPTLQKDDISSLIKALDDFIERNIRKEHQWKARYLQREDDIESIQRQIKEVSNVDNYFKLILANLANILEKKGDKDNSNTVKKTSVKVCRYSKVFSSIFENTYLTMRDGSNQKLVWISIAWKVQKFSLKIRIHLEGKLAYEISDYKRVEELKKMQQELKKKLQEGDQKQNGKFQQQGYQDMWFALDICKKIFNVAMGGLAGSSFGPFGAIVGTLHALLKQL